jgi:hypothetical protein
VEAFLDEQMSAPGHEADIIWSIRAFPLVILSGSHAYWMLSPIVDDVGAWAARGAALAAPDFVSLNSRADAAYVVNDALVVMNRNSGIVVAR